MKIEEVKDQLERPLRTFKELKLRYEKALEEFSKLQNELSGLSPEVEASNRNVETWSTEVAAKYAALLRRQGDGHLELAAILKDKAVLVLDISQLVVAAKEALSGT